jgi:hypothetical protein
MNQEHESTDQEYESIDYLTKCCRRIGHKVADTLLDPEHPEDHKSVEHGIRRYVWDRGGALLDTPAEKPELSQIVFDALKRIEEQDILMPARPEDHNDCLTAYAQGLEEGVEARLDCSSQPENRYA